MYVCISIYCPSVGLSIVLAVINVCLRSQLGAHRIYSDLHRVMDLALGTPSGGGQVQDPQLSMRLQS